MSQIRTDLDDAISCYDGQNNEITEGMLHDAFNELLDETRPDAAINQIYALCAQEEEPSQIVILAAFQKLRQSTLSLAEYTLEQEKEARRQ